VHKSYGMLLYTFLEDIITMKDNRFQTIEELLSDESFLAWYFKTDEKKVMQWNEIIDTDVFYRELAEKAVSLLNEMTACSSFHQMFSPAGASMLHHPQIRTVHFSEQYSQNPHPSIQETHLAWMVQNGCGLWHYPVLT
jgi:hypothetical protein